MTEDEEGFDDLFVLENAADKIQTGEDFIKFLDLIQREILDDDEVDKRLQLDFFSVISRKLQFAADLPDFGPRLIDLPDTPDWKWLAHLFIVGAFEN